jgi:hypothetical protein
MSSAQLGGAAIRAAASALKTLVQLFFNTVSRRAAWLQKRSGRVIESKKAGIATRLSLFYDFARFAQRRCQRN